MVKEQTSVLLIVVERRAFHRSIWSCSLLIMKKNTMDQNNKTNVRSMEDICTSRLKPVDYARISRNNQAEIDSMPSDIIQRQQKLLMQSLPPKVLKRFLQRRKK